MKNILYFTKQFIPFQEKFLYFNLLGMVLISLFEGVGFLLIPLISLTGILDVNSEDSLYHIVDVCIFQGFP